MSNAADPTQPGGRLGRLRFDLQRAWALAIALLKFWVAPALGARLGRRDAPSEATRLRMFLESLGVTYHKLGQYLAIRWDILPREVCDELSRMFESIEPMAFSVVQERLREELGDDISLFFSNIEPECIGAASIAQVHRATTRDGDIVAIKVQRRGIAEVFRADIRNLRRVAQILDKSGLAGEQSMAGIVDEFSSFTLREMNFEEEGRTAERMAENPSAHAYIPRVFWKFTTPFLLTIEYIDGISLARAVQLMQGGDYDQLA